MGIRSFFKRLSKRELSPLETFRPAVKMAVALVVTFLAAAIGSYFTLPSIGTWYAALAHPSFAPPNWVFGPVWTALYGLMAVSAFLVWKNESSANAVRTRVALGWYVVQLGFNALWSVVFFGWHHIGLALWVLAALWLSIAITMVTFRRLNRAAAWLLAPYLLWVTFAGLLNYSFWILNP